MKFEVLVYKGDRMAQEGDIELKGPRKFFKEFVVFEKLLVHIHFQIAFKIN